MKKKWIYICLVLSGRRNEYIYIYIYICVCVCVCVCVCEKRKKKKKEKKRCRNRLGCCANCVTIQWKLYRDITVLGVQLGWGIVLQHKAAGFRSIAIGCAIWPGRRSRYNWIVS